MLISFTHQQILSTAGYPNFTYRVGLTGDTNVLVSLSRACVGETISNRSGSSTGSGPEVGGFRIPVPWIGFLFYLSIFVFDVCCECALHSLQQAQCWVVLLPGAMRRLHAQFSALEATRSCYHIDVYDQAVSSKQLRLSCARMRRSNHGAFFD